MTKEDYFKLCNGNEPVENRKYIYEEPKQMIPRSITLDEYDQLTNLINNSMNDGSSVSNAIWESATTIQKLKKEN